MPGCPNCQKVFTKQSSLNRHLTSAHSDKSNQFVCGECNKSFIRRDNLLRHQKIHDGFSRFLCENCTRTFWRKDHFEQHQEKCEGKVDRLDPGSSTTALPPSCGFQPNSVQESSRSRHETFQDQSPSPYFAWRITKDNGTESPLPRLTVAADQKQERHISATSIKRSKGLGCTLCRRRRVSCDLGRPKCFDCTRLNTACHYRKSRSRRYHFSKEYRQAGVSDSVKQIPISVIQRTEQEKASALQASLVQREASLVKDALEDDHFTALGFLPNTDAPSYHEDDLNLDTIEQILETLAGYDELGRVEIDRWPSVDDTTVLSPPHHLCKDLQTLCDTFSDAAMEVVMRPHQLNTLTNAIVRERLQPGAVADPGFKLLLIPAVKCHDCPGRLYLARPGNIVDDLEAHMHNRSHRHSVKLRQAIESNSLDESMSAVLHAVKTNDAGLLKRSLARAYPPGQPQEWEGFRRNKTWSMILTHTISFGTAEMLACIFAHKFVPLYDSGSKGHTWLHLACHLGKNEMVQILLVNGASLKARDYADRTPIDRAMQEGHLETAVLAVRQWASQKHLSPVPIACMFGWTEIVDTLFQQGEGVHGGSPSLHNYYLATKANDSDEDDDVDPKDRYKSYFKHLKIMHSDTDPVKAASRPPRQRVIMPEDALNEALTWAPAATVRLVLEAGAKIGPSHERSISLLKIKSRSTSHARVDVASSAARLLSTKPIDEAISIPSMSSKKQKYSEPEEKLEILCEFGLELYFSSEESLRDSASSGSDG